MMPIRINGYNEKYDDGEKKKQAKNRPRLSKNEKKGRITLFLLIVECSSNKQETTVKEREGKNNILYVRSMRHSHSFSPMISVNVDTD